MKGTETGKDKVKKICDLLKKETLDPARIEAENIVEKAQEKAERILFEAKKEVERMHEEARVYQERQKIIFHTAIAQGCKQTVDSLKQTIEEKLFKPELKALLGKIQEPALLAKLIEAVIKALDKEGIDANLSVYIPASVPAREINSLLASNIVSRLKEKGVLLSSIGGGIEVKLHKENITIDISDAALKELVSHYIRKDFRDLLFGNI